MVIAQRLVRQLCPKCKVKKNVGPELEAKIRKLIAGLPSRVKKDDYAKPDIYEAKGCDACGRLGYKGRTSIFELLLVDEPMEAAIYQNPTEIYTSLFVGSVRCV